MLYVFIECDHNLASNLKRADFVYFIDIPVKNSNHHVLRPLSIFNALRICYPLFYVLESSHVQVKHHLATIAHYPYVEI